MTLGTCLRGEHLVSQLEGRHRRTVGEPWTQSQEEGRGGHLTETEWATCVSEETKTGPTSVYESENWGLEISICGWEKPGSTGTNADDSVKVCRCHHFWRQPSLKSWWPHLSCLEVKHITLLKFFKTLYRLSFFCVPSVVGRGWRDKRFHREWSLGATPSPISNVLCLLPLVKSTDSPSCKI